MELGPSGKNGVVVRQRALVVSGREAEHVTVQLQHAVDMLVPDPTRKRNLAIPTNLAVSPQTGANGQTALRLVMVPANSSGTVTTSAQPIPPSTVTRLWSRVRNVEKSHASLNARFHNGQLGRNVQYPVVRARSLENERSLYPLPTVPRTSSKRRTATKETAHVLMVKSGATTPCVSARAKHATRTLTPSVARTYLAACVQRVCIWRPRNVSTSRNVRSASSMARCTSRPNLSQPQTPANTASAPTEKWSVAGAVKYPYVARTKNSHMKASPTYVVLNADPSHTPAPCTQTGASSMTLSLAVCLLVKSNTRTARDLVEIRTTCL